MLHKESPLGEITLECFLTGAKNVFQVRVAGSVGRPDPLSVPVVFSCFSSCAAHTGSHLSYW